MSCSVITSLSSLIEEALKLFSCHGAERPAGIEGSCQDRSRSGVESKLGRYTGSISYGYRCEVGSQVVLIHRVNQIWMQVQTREPSRVDT